jgi:hypothetical protein
MMVVATPASAECIRYAAASLKVSTAPAPDGSLTRVAETLPFICTRLPGLRRVVDIVPASWFRLRRAYRNRRSSQSTTPNAAKSADIHPQSIDQAPPPPGHAFSFPFSNPLLFGLFFCDPRILKAL